MHAESQKFNERAWQRNNHHHNKKKKQIIMAYYHVKFQWLISNKIKERNFKKIFTMVYEELEEHI